MAEQDNVWKEILEVFFKDFLAFFFLDIHEKVDWQRGYEFLDKELEKLDRDNEIGKRLADKLVKVYLLGGQEALLYIHIEVQGYPDRSFEERMYIYNYRIFDRYRQPVISLAVLTDVSAKYRPSHYEVKMFGFEHSFRFPTVKLMDYNKKWAALEANPNPFAIIVMAHLKARNEKNSEQKLAWKLRLVRMLVERSYNRQQILQLFRFIDWLIKLPKELDLSFEQEIARDKEEGKMPYITSIERIGMERLASTMLTEQLKERFGEIEPVILEHLSKLELDQLLELNKASVHFSSPQQVTEWLDKKTAKPPTSKAKPSN